MFAVYVTQYIICHAPAYSISWGTETYCWEKDRHYFFLLIFCVLSHAAHIFCRLFLQGLSLSLFGRLVIVPVDSPTFKGPFHCFPTLSSLYFSLSLSLKCHLAFLFLFRWFISTGLLACCFDCSTNEIVVCFWLAALLVNSFGFLCESLNTEVQSLVLNTSI